MEKTKSPSIPKLKHEPSKWYSRLVSYCLLGASRSFTTVYNAEKPKTANKSPKKHLSGGWKQAIKKYKWRERAEAYDKAIIEQEIKKMEALRLVERKKRLDLLILARQKLEAMIKVSPLDATWSAIASLIRALGDESRAELEVVSFEKRLKELEVLQKSKTGNFSTIAREIVKALDEKDNP